MTIKTRRSLLLLVPLGLAAWEAGDALAGGPLHRALAGDEEATARRSIEALRRQGPPAVAALLSGAPPEGSPQRARWERTLDAVCAQRDCAASGLYWYTDLDLARAEALRTGKPILSLRLLGRLDEEVSCANSRFFRTVLYPDPRVSQVLRERFVLHWASERPVPRLSIDFGDGRRLEGTITGNSVHYVLDTRGRVVDALPGLYGPGLFLDRLQAAEEEARGWPRSTTPTSGGSAPGSTPAVSPPSPRSWPARPGETATRRLSRSRRANRRPPKRRRRWRRPSRPPRCRSWPPCRSVTAPLSSPASTGLRSPPATPATGD